MPVTSTRFGSTPRLTRWMFQALWGLVRNCPTSLGVTVRCALLRGFGASVSRTATVGTGVRILAPGGLTLGSETGVARDVLLDCRSGITVGNRTMIGFETALLTATHPREASHDRHNLALEGSPILIGDDVWLGARCFVFPGVSVGDASIVGTMSLVNRSVDKADVVAGVPARSIEQTPDVSLRRD